MPPPSSPEAHELDSESHFTAPNRIAEHLGPSAYPSDLHRYNLLLRYFLRNTNTHPYIPSTLSTTTNMRSRQRQRQRRLGLEIARNADADRRRLQLRQQVERERRQLERSLLESENYNANPTNGSEGDDESMEIMPLMDSESLQEYLLAHRIASSSSSSSPSSVSSSSFNTQSESDTEAENDHINNMNQDFDLLRSDIRSNERLLLSSARQNHTNRNTLIHNTAVPLRRQNAIRRSESVDRLTNIFRSHLPRFTNASSSDLVGPESVRNFNSNSYLSSEEIKNLGLEVAGSIRAIIESFKSSHHFKGMSPIFNSHSPDHRMTAKTMIHLLKYDRNTTFLSLEDKLDCFLFQRKLGLCWNPVWDEFTDRELSDSPPPSGLFSPKKLRNERKHNSGMFKRQRSSEDVRQYKKLKTASEKVPNPNHLFVPRKPEFYSDGELISAKNLTLEQKHNIMNILPCAYLKPGSTFGVSIGALSMELNFSQVEYKLKNLFGSFNIAPEPENFANLEEAIEFFGGFNTSLATEEISNIPRDEVLQEKIHFAKLLFASYKSNPASKRKKPKTFSVPFEGHLIDFKETDLRFLHSKKEEVPVVATSTGSLTNSKCKTQKVRFQLLEWLNVEPFQHCAGMFFLNNLEYLHQNLRRVNHLKGSKRDHVFESLDGIKKNINVIASKYRFTEILKETGANDIIKKLTNSRTSLVRTGFESRFVLDWDKRLADKLCDFLSCRQHCMLNVQLNFVLFTVKVSYSSMLDMYIDFLIDSIVDESERNKYKSIVTSFTKSQTSSASQFNTTLLCSLNRKTGELQIHNPLSSVSYNNKYADLLNPSTRESSPRNRRGYRRGNAQLESDLAFEFSEEIFGTLDDDGEPDLNLADDGERTEEQTKLMSLFDSINHCKDPFYGYSFKSGYVNPAINKSVRTTLRGGAKNSSSRQISIGGGHSNFSFV